jgi:signal transduction histidine kinase
VNEFTVWEILEPLIQNSIDHCSVDYVTIRIQTKYNRKENISHIYISDNGKGIAAELLEPGPKDIKRIFLEHETKRDQRESHSGYGCYIAYQLAAGKCGWKLDVENLADGGCMFKLTISN